MKFRYVDVKWRHLIFITILKCLSENRAIPSFDSVLHSSVWQISLLLQNIINYAYGPSESIDIQESQNNIEIIDRKLDTKRCWQLQGIEDAQVFQVWKGNVERKAVQLMEGRELDERNATRR